MSKKIYNHCKNQPPKEEKTCAGLKCENNKECDDFNICTMNICTNGTCSFPAVSNTTSCQSDNDYCTRDICMLGKCTHIPFVPCCGNGIKEEGEQCDDGNRKSNDGCSKSCTVEGCIVSICNDGNPCTIDSCFNNQCMHTSITFPANDDGCCPEGADANTDDDCAPVCGNTVLEIGEQCEPPNTATCNANCQNIISTTTGACCLPLGVLCTVLSQSSCTSQGGSFIGNGTICSGNDTDGDSIEDTCDNCPNIFNLEQTDTDNDGIGDACENGNIVLPCSTDEDCLVGQTCNTVLGLCA